MRSGFADRFTPKAGRMACLACIAVLACVSSAHGQVIEEDGAPAKGNDVSRGPFSLACPPGLVVGAGASVLLSCTATATPEEGVRYEWESVSGEGLDLLSDGQALSPFFTAPPSAANAEYAYRLTATGPGAYAAASVTVAVESVLEETAGAPVLQEECDPLLLPGDPGAGCQEEKGPVPFEIDPEEGFLFPHAPGPGGGPSGLVRGGGPDTRAAPLLECPAAVFLDELETGVIECHAWDASGQEYLEYFWEPTGSTTRNYLDNPRLVPEDSPTPSVIAPEAQAHETLESFRSAETTFRYRYRLTATSRATGLSSSSEVEVHVSGNRPSVYCPLEVTVKEGETVRLDCEGADPLAYRMDYDEEEASVLWEWEGLWGTSMAPLAGAELSSPLFTAPAGSAGKQYHYIASMTTSALGAPRTARRRVTVRVADTENAEQALLSSKTNAPSIACEDAEEYEATDNFRLNCTATDKPAGATYAWTARGSTSDTSDLLNTDSLRATFSVPVEVGGADKDYEYTVTMTAGGVEQASEDITVTVLEKPNIRCARIDFSYTAAPDVSPGRTLRIDFCPGGFRDAPAGSDYAFEWIPVPTAHVSGQAALAALDRTDMATAVFTAPVASPSPHVEMFYTYRLRVSAENADPHTTTTIGTRVRVRNRSALSVSCSNSFYEVDEGSPDFELDCEASGAWFGRGYTWQWSPTVNLTNRDTGTPTFNVPGDVEGDTTWTYTVKVTSEGHHPDEEIVEVRVRNTDMSIGCTDPAPVYEGDPDFALSCTVQHAPDDVSYSWTSPDAPADTSLLSATNIRNPLFDVPETVEANETYGYLLTATAEGATAATQTVTVTVLNKLPIAVSCQGNPWEAYEGEDDFMLDCSASGAPSGSTYDYAWTPRGSTADTDKLSDPAIAKPTFDVPDELDADETYEYTLTVRAENAIDAEADVTVRVLNKPQLVLACTPPAPVYEGAEDFALDCAASGAPSGSTYDYAWTPRGDTPDTDRLSDPAVAKPTFAVPETVEADETHEYTLTVRAENAIDAEADVTVRVLNKPQLVLACTPPAPVYEGAEDFALECTASGAPPGVSYEYAWAGRGSTADTDKLSDPAIAKPTFDVPDELDADETYEYTLTVRAENAEDATTDVTVTVLDKKPLEVACATPSPVYEGAEDFALECAASGAPAGSDYAYAWTGRGGTTNTDKFIAGADGPTPTFAVPETVEEDETYEYLLTVSAANAIDAGAEVTVRVLKLGSVALICASPPLVYEGSEDFALECSVSGDTGEAEYAYEWTADGATQDVSLLSAAEVASPTFLVPENIASTTTYEYLLTARADGVRDATARVAVTVLNRRALAVACAPAPLTYEGSADFDLDCDASGAPAGSGYEYEWTARGDTPDTALLSDATLLSPTFLVPNEVAATATYEYLLTARAKNAEPGTAEITVTVLDRGALHAVCTDPPSVYEGSADFAFDCSASGAPQGAAYEYAWTARGATQDTDLLSDATLLSPTFLVPNEVAATATYEYLLTARAENAEPGTAEITVTVLDRGALHAVCTDPPSVYEGSADFAFDCSASGAPQGAAYEYAWTARGATQDTDLLSDATLLSPTFLVPNEVAATATYEYLLTARAENAEPGTAEITVTVLDRGALHAVCTDPPSVYEGSADFAFDCSASGAPQGAAYEYAWTARGGTQDTDLLSDATLLAPTFHVPDEVAATTTYEYLLTARAENAEPGTAEITVTVLKQGALYAACAEPGAVYEGSEDITFDCSASGASDYAYAWTARGATPDVSLLSAADVVSPTFLVPDKVDETATYEYLLTVGAENAQDATAEVTVTVLNKPALAVACAGPWSAYEGTADVELDCEASGAPGDNPQYAYVWTGDQAALALLSAADIASPTFYVPDEVDGDETWEYTLTVHAENADDAAAEATVTVLNKPSLVVVCAGPYALYEGSDDFILECEASGAPAGSDYAYAWTAGGDTQDTSLLSATDIVSPTFLVPDDLPATTTYEYLLRASAENAEDDSAGVRVTVMHPAPLVFTDDAIDGRVYVFTVGETIEEIALPEAKGGFPPYAYALSGALPEGLSFDDGARTISGTPSEVSPRREYAWRASDTNNDMVQLGFSIEVVPVPGVAPPVAEEGSPDASLLSAGYGVTTSVSPLRFGVQSADTQVSIDPATDRIATNVAGPYHAGRMTLSADAGEAALEGGEEIALSVELAAPALLRREGDDAGSSTLALSPSWSWTKSCEGIASQALEGLYAELAFSEGDCPLLLFGGELDLTDALPGRYEGAIDVILRQGDIEETRTLEVEVTVISPRRAITIGPAGVRLDTSGETPVGLTEEQNLSIYPDIAFLNAEKPSEAFELSNPSLVPLEVSVSARFGYTEAADDREIVVDDPAHSDLGDLSEWVDIHPSVLVLMPGEKGLVRYGIREGALSSLTEQGYAAFFDIVSSPRQYVARDRLPEEVTGERTARVTMRVPGVYAPSGGASRLRAELLTITKGIALSATFLVEALDGPFVGEVIAYDGDGRELGRREALVYTRSRVRVPLSRLPEEEAAFLRFAPRGAGRAPKPASIRWNAPPSGDIGDAGNGNRTEPPETLVRRP